MADPARLEAIVRQHAKTSELLGVPFVPVYRSGAAGEIAVKPVSDGAVEPVEPQPVEPPAKAPPAKSPGPTQPSPESDSDSGSKAGAVIGSSASATDPAAALDALRERYIADAPHDGFETEYTNIVFGEGDPAARLMFVGEAPGADEDRLGRPFVGKSGQLLDKMIVAMGLSRESVYIANVLKTRPPGNRTPTIEEARLCAPYLYEQIRIVSPDVIVTLGKSAGQLLLGTGDSMGAMRGKWAEFPPPTPLVPVEGIPAVAVMPTYHPAYLLRSYTPENRAKVWADLKMVMDRLGLG